jgi:hypothetical protein
MKANKGHVEQAGGVNRPGVVHGEEASLHLLHPASQLAFCDIDGYAEPIQDIGLHLHDFIKIGVSPAFRVMGKHEINACAFLIQTVGKEYFRRLHIHAHEDASYFALGISVENTAVCIRVNKFLRIKKGLILGLEFLIGLRRLPQLCLNRSSAAGVRVDSRGNGQIV